MPQEFIAVLSFVAEHIVTINYAIVGICILVAVDILSKHIVARIKQNIFYVSRSRGRLWKSGVAVTVLLLALSLWANIREGVAAPHSQNSKPDFVLDRDDLMAVLTTSTAQGELSKKNTLKDSVRGSAEKLLLSSTAAFDRALAYMGLDQFEESIELIDLEIKRVATNGDQPHLIPRLMYFRAMANSLGGSNQDALNDYNEALKRNPFYAEAHMNKAFLLIKMKDFPEARKSMAQAARFANKREYPCLLGAAYLQLRDWSLAIVHFDLAIALDPAYPEALAMRSVAALQLKFSLRSSSDADSALVHDPTNSLAQSQRAVLIGFLKNIDSIRQNLDKAISYEESDTCEVLVQGAKAFIRAEDYLLASEELDRALVFCAGNFQAWYYAALVSNKRQAYQEALIHIDAAIEIDKGSSEALALKSIILKDSGLTFAEYYKYVDSAFRIGSRTNRALAWVLKGETMVELNEIDSANIALDSALAASRRKKQPQLGLRIASSLYEAGDGVKALEAIDLALDYDPKSPDALALRDTILEQESH